MRALERKLWRDLWQLKGQAVAIALVVMCGVGTYIMFLATLSSLRDTQASFYRDFRFAHVFSSLQRAPEAVRERLAEIPGVDFVETRVVANVMLDMPGFGEPVTGLLVSLPDGKPPGLNGLHLRQGRLPLAERIGEVVASAPFAQAHRLQPGDRFAAILNGRRQMLTLVGTALSPEFVQQMRPGALFPDYKRYGVLWMGREVLGRAQDMDGAFNDVALSLRPGANELTIIDSIDRILFAYGGLGAYAREDQRSHRFLSEEFAQLETLSSLFPAIFLAVAAFLLNVVISRVVAMQREQIATLKAFGYGNVQILVHYLALVTVIAAAGSACGVGLGVLLGQSLSAIYMEFYRFPYLNFHVRLGIVAEALSATFVAAMAGTVFAVWRAARLRPAEAMRPEPPAQYGESWVEKLGFKAWLTAPSRMILRHIQRRALRSMVTVFGIAIGCGIILTGMFQADTVEYMIRVQYGMSAREDLTVTFTHPTGYRARFDLLGVPGVKHVEVFRTVPVRLWNGHRSERTGIRGMEPGGDIQRLLDLDLKSATLPDDGMLMTDYLAEKLALRVGDRVVVEVLEGSRPRRETTLVGIVKEYMGLSGYMNLDALNRFMHEGPTISGAYLSIDSDQRQTLFTKLREMPRVAGVAERVQEIRNFNRVMEESMLFFTYVATAFAVIIAFGVVYNSARIALTERARELASLRVLGFTVGEIAYILLGELALLTALAIPIGLALGYAMCFYIALNLQNDLYRVPLILNPQTYAFASAVVVIATVLSGWVVLRRLVQLDLVSVLKSAE